ncbi:MAG: hypothetical protein GY744_12745 [Gammaproteobacteria bacterium]|nr:hypothetical protein [Gammaproteobacteria bacterium]
MESSSRRLTDGKGLSFEAYIEDDGECINLLGPYDDRDGKFQDLGGCDVDDY